MCTHIICSSRSHLQVVGCACNKYRLRHTSLLLSSPTLSTFLPLGGSRTRTSIIVSFSTPIIHAFSRHLLCSSYCVVVGGHAERISPSVQQLCVSHGGGSFLCRAKGFLIFLLFAPRGDGERPRVHKSGIKRGMGGCRAEETLPRGD